MCLCRNLFNLQKYVCKLSRSSACVLTNSSHKNINVGFARRYCHEESGSPPTDFTTKKTTSNTSFIAPDWGRYKVFEDDSAPLILDIEEERRKAFENIQDVQDDEFSGINLNRGIDGVFDIDDLVELLKRENAQNIFVARLPSNINYVDFIVVVSGKSSRHMAAMAEFIRKVFKRKMYDYDCIPKIEGANSKDWIAMDLGNIAVHIFSNQSRSVYDLESLWSVGSQFDELCNMPEDPLVQLLERHSVYLGDLQPANTLG